MELHTNLFEIVPLQLNKHAASKTIAKSIRDKEYQKKRRSLETEGTKIARLQKAIAIKRESSQRKLTARNKVDLKKMESLKKGGSFKKLKVRDKKDSKKIESLKNKSSLKKLKVRDK